MRRPAAAFLTIMPEERDRRDLNRPVLQDGPSLVVVFILVLFSVHLMREVLAAPGQSMSDPRTPGVVSVDNLRRGEWWTAITHLFIHGGWGHLLGNVVLLWLAGRRVLDSAGTRHFLLLYFASGLAGSACALAAHPEYPVTGASGAIFGVIGAYAALFPERSVTGWIHRIAPWRLRARFLFWGLLGAEVFLEVLSSLTADGPRVPFIHDVAHLAHIGGLVTGWIYGGRLAAGAFPVWMRDDFFPKVPDRRKEGPVRALLRPAGVAPGNAFPERQTVQAAPEPPPRLPTDEEFLRDVVDPILDKLYDSGMNSLTDEERAILNEAANRFSRRAR